MSLSQRRTHRLLDDASGILVAIPESNATRCLAVGTNSKSDSFVVLFLFQLVSVAQTSSGFVETHQSWRFLMMIMVMRADRNEQRKERKAPTFIILTCIAIRDHLFIASGVILIDHLCFTARPTLY
jgi:hypothetical protein